MHASIFRSSFTLLMLFAVLSGCGGTRKSTTSAPAPKDGMTDVQRADVTYTFLNASKEKILGNWNTAAELYADVIRKDPQNAAAMYELSNVYVEQKKFTDALFFSKSAYKLDLQNDWYAQHYAYVLQRNGRFKESAEVYVQLIKRHPNEEMYYLELADAYVYAGEFEEAIKAYDQLEANFGITEEFVINKCRIYQQLKKPEKAIQELQKLITADPRNVEVYGMLAELYQVKGDTAKALETFLQIEKIDPENPFVHLSLADFYRTAGNKEKSFEELKLAFQNQQLEIETKISILGSYYSLVEQYPELKDQSVMLCELLVVAHPSDPRSYAVRGDFLVQEKKYEAARVDYRKARDLGSKDYSVFSQLLFLDSQLQDWQSMLTDSEEALSLFPDQPFVYFFNGIAKQQNKKYAEAIAVLNTGLNLVVDNPELESSFNSSMGEAYHELNEHAKSDQRFERALELDPNDATVMNNYAYFLSLRGERLDRAEALSKKSNELEPDNTSYEDTYGWIMFMMGNFKDAKTWIEKSLLHGGENSAAVLEHYGDVLYKLGDTQQALDYWQRAKSVGDGASDQLDQKILQKKFVE